MIYIRHAEKAYKNGGASEYSLDPELTNQGRVTAREKFEHLLNTYGIPDKIITSPYLRARETAEIAADVLFQMTGFEIELIYDCTLGEYLGNQKHKDITNCLRSETLIHNPIPPESWDQYTHRIRKHIKSRSQSNIWYITHGIVIKTIARLIGEKIDYPGPLEGIRISNKIITTI